MYMLDTSVCVDLIRGRASETELPSRSECVLSVITVAELEVGIRRSTRPAAQRQAVEAFTSFFEVFPWDLQAASHYGELRVDLEKRGIGIGPLDLLIAAHAHQLGAALVTGNIREFQRVSGLSCLEWTKS
ncbi:MAG TPA: type II toxin-antitoxin system VapC family toxin [Thermoanaerobaculia bacterium]